MEESLGKHTGLTFDEDTYLIQTHFEYVIKAMEAYAQQFKSNIHLPTISEYQLCPKCNGEGRVPNTGTSTSTHSLCDVCNGSKTLIKPVAMRDQLKSPTIDK